MTATDPKTDRDEGEQKQLPQTRMETGQVCFGDDWTGVFIRGDNSLWYAHLLQQLLDGGEVHPIHLGNLRGLQRLLSGCDERQDIPGVQKMKPYEECKADT